ncbi:JAB domain-containing protein [Clostridium sp. 19966]|uniref:JAB domain-containing protein n=1 Tax=Clostridium sp. 19966 TaxID=2768166 RepID=UPI0028DDEAF4|nr:JAB domain-containing protein [Clostridium sp. 19966]MDT8716228.1 JAB domain-containing protein [Clostridium sp. 19966]
MLKYDYSTKKESKNNASKEHRIINTSKNLRSKRVDIVSIKMIKEASMLYRNRMVNSPNDAYKLVKKFLEGSDREQLIVCSLDTKNQPTTINVVSVGTLNSSLVHPKELFKPVILSNAASIIVSHFHPSGDRSPSSEDINITNRIKECGTSKVFRRKTRTKWQVK